VEMVSYLTSQDLNRVLAAAEVVVCRAGYSSVMDLAALGKRALLIPTPGQTEQEYLAQYLGERKLFHAQSQDKIDLATGLAALRHTTGCSPEAFCQQDFEPVLQEWLESLPAPRR
ncbi:MAG TPA: glycosyltransferase, partial [Saprospiraceae bacterium]|nr:glycosyltransferase [Saprospiraceae bacterium]